MAYITLSEFKSYISELSGGVQTSFGGSEDTVLQSFIDQATAEINATTGRSYEATTTTKRFGADSVYDEILLLDCDLLTVSAVTNGDGATITSYTLLPRNTTPYCAIELTAASWDTTADIQVTGAWGYSTSASADVKRVAMRLAYFYWQKRAATGESQIFGDGVIQVAAGYPADVREWLNQHRRRAF